MIGQYLSNTNESATCVDFPKLFETKQGLIRKREEYNMEAGNTVRRPNNTMQAMVANFQKLQFYMKKCDTVN